MQTPVSCIVLPGPHSEPECPICRGKGPILALFDFVGPETLSDYGSAASGGAEVPLPPVPPPPFPAEASPYAASMRAASPHSASPVHSRAASPSVASPTRATGATSSSAAAEPTLLFPMVRTWRAYRDRFLGRPRYGQE